MRSISCAACGAVIRAGRPTCLRCGAPFRPRLAESGMPKPRRVPTRERGVPKAALAAAAVLVLTGAASLYVRERPPAVISAPASGTQAVDVASSLSPDSTRIDPSAVAMEAGRLGGAAYNRGELTGALSQFEAAVEANPDDPVALNNLGQVLVRDGNASAAIGYFDRAVALAPATWSYRFNRARAYAQIRQWAQAIEGYRDASRLFPDDYVTEFNLAQALRETGELNEALQHFDRAITLAPGQADFHLSRGLTLEAAGRPAEAIAAYQDYLELESDGQDAGNVRARIEGLQRTDGTSASRLDGVQ